MTNILGLQATEVETPADEKRSNDSWLLCGGVGQSNRSHIFC